MLFQTKQGSWRHVLSTQKREMDFLREQLAEAREQLAEQAQELAAAAAAARAEPCPKASLHELRQENETLLVQLQTLTQTVQQKVLRDEQRETGWQQALQRKSRQNEQLLARLEQLEQRCSADASAEEREEECKPQPAPSAGDGQR